jgi:hypothetical protein
LKPAPSEAKSIAKALVESEVKTPNFVVIKIVPRVHDDGTLGFANQNGLVESVKDPLGEGIFIRDEANADTLAHEFGHMLNLTRNESQHANTKMNNEGEQEIVRNDSWIRARVMATFITSGGYFLTIRGHGPKQDPTDDELRIARKVVRDYYKAKK